MLVAAAHAMGTHLRAEDQLGRLGGEEFLVLLPDTDAERGRARGREAARRGRRRARTPVPVTVSIGVATWDGEAPEDLLHRADEALYAAKEARARPCHGCYPARPHMTMTAEEKREIVSRFGRDETDTGKTEVQVALLTHRINHLTEHLREHKHDHHSRRGLLMLVGRRRRFLNYMQKNDLEGYRTLIRELGLRR